MQRDVPSDKASLVKRSAVPKHVSRGLIFILFVSLVLFVGLLLIEQSHVDNRQEIRGGSAASSHKPQQITAVVLSMHRSGSSMMMGILDLMGFHIGSSDELYEAAPDNPKGFFERIDVVTVNKNIFQAQSHDGFENSLHFSYELVSHSFTSSITNTTINKIMRRLGERKAVAIKDPRMCITLPIWMDHLENPFFIILHRNPFEVAKSLEHRSKKKLHLNIGFKLWEKYTLSALNFTYGRNRLLVSHEELISRPDSVLGEIYEIIGDLERYNLKKLSQNDISQWIDTSLVHQNHDQREASKLMTPHQTNIFQSLADKSALSRRWNLMEDKEGNPSCHKIPSNDICPNWAEFKTKTISSVDKLLVDVQKSTKNTGFRIPSVRAASYPVSEDCRSVTKEYLCINKLKDVSCHTPSHIVPTDWNFPEVTHHNFLRVYYEKYKPVVYLDKDAHALRRTPRIAYLLMVHKDKEWINRLLQSIYDRENIYIIHVDLGADVKSSQKIVEILKSENKDKNNVIFMEPRIRVRWGGSSIVAVQLAGIIQSLSFSEWDFWINLSENDFPLKSPEFIRDYLSKFRGKNFMTLRKSKDKLKELEQYRLRFLFVECSSGVYKTNHVQSVIPQTKFARGEQWVILDRRFSHYLVHDQRAKQLWEFFQTSYIPDESFVHTVLHDSAEFSSTLVEDHMRYIHMPHNIIHPSELGILKTTDKLFARKFNDTKLVQELYEWLKS